MSRVARSIALNSGCGLVALALMCWLYLLKRGGYVRQRIGEERILIFMLEIDGER